jgi:hypothetical protein
MKNFINRALVAKKHLKLFFALFAMLALGVGNAWGAEVTFDATSNKGSTSTGAVSFEKDGITLSAENGALGNGTDYRIYKNTKLPNADPCPSKLIKHSIIVPIPIAETYHRHSQSLTRSKSLTQKRSSFRSSFRCLISKSQLISF